MKRKDLHPGQYVSIHYGPVFREPKKACIIATGGWLGLEDFQKKPDFYNTGVIVTHVRASGNKLLCSGENLPDVAIAVFDAKDESWIPDVVPLGKITCTWKWYEECTKEERENKQVEDEKARLIEQGRVLFLNNLRRQLMDLGLNKVDVPGITFEEDRVSPLTEENDIVLDMYELKMLLDRIETDKETV